MVDLNLKTLSLRMSLEPQKKSFFQDFVSEEEFFLRDFIKIPVKRETESIMMWNFHGFK